MIALILISSKDLAEFAQIPALLLSLNQKADTIMSEVENVLTDIAAVKAQLVATTDQIVRNAEEVATKIAALEAAVGDAALPDAVVVAIADLKATAAAQATASQAADDAVPA